MINNIYSNLPQSRRISLSPCEQWEAVKSVSRTVCTRSTPRVWACLGRPRVRTLRRCCLLSRAERRSASSRRSWWAGCCRQGDQAIPEGALRSVSNTQFGQLPFRFKSVQYSASKIFFFNYNLKILNYFYKIYFNINENGNNNLLLLYKIINRRLKKKIIIL